eukprot:59000_1
MQMLLILFLCAVSFINVHSQNVSALTIEISCAPQSGAGSNSYGPEIKGVVYGIDELAPLYSHTDFKVVIYSQTNVWWVQPWANQPLTEISSDGSWSAQIHLGWNYYVFLVRNGFNPPSTWSRGNPELFVNNYEEYVIDFDFSKPGVVCGDIQITCAPEAGGGKDSFGPRIRGNVKFDLLPQGYDYDNFKVVIYSHTYYWYIQPYINNPMNMISDDGTFSVQIHLGDYYSVYLVNSNFTPTATWNADYPPKWYADRYSDYVIDFDTSEPEYVIPAFL